jgi:hypothetical protein
MAATDITIVRRIPVVHGFLQIPDNKEQYRHKVSVAAARAAVGKTAIGTGAWIRRLGAGGATRTAGVSHGRQELFELPETGVTAIDTKYNALRALVP